MKWFIGNGFFLLIWPVVTTSIVHSELLSPQQNPSEVPIRLSTELLLLDVQVISRKTGQPIAGLEKGDFSVSEDGVRQDITHFSQDQLPLSIILLLDLSGSVKPYMEKIRDGAWQAFQRLKPEDEVAIMGFATRAELVQDFTTDRRLIADGIASTKQTPETGRRTFLNEAVYQAALHLRRASNPSSRSVIIVVTDNMSTQRRFEGHSEREALEELFEPGSVVCGLVLAHKLINAITKPAALTRKVFLTGSVRTYADKTGGVVMSARKEEVEIKLTELIDHLRSRYTIGYASSNPTLDGKFRRLKVRLSPAVEKREGKLAVLTRRGYYARPRETETVPVPNGSRVTIP